MNLLSETSSYSRRSGGVLLVVGGLAVVTVGGGVAGAKSDVAFCFDTGSGWCIV